MSPKFREILYKFGVVVIPLLGVLATFGFEQANSLTIAVTAILSVFGVTISGTAAYNTAKQRKDGVFDSSDPAPPEHQIIDGLTKLQQQKDALDAAVGTVTNALSGATKDIPVLGPLASQILSQIK